MPKPSITDYQTLLEKATKANLDIDSVVELLLCVAIHFGIEIKDQTDEMAAYATIHNWQNSIKNQDGGLVRFYENYIIDDIDSTALLLEHTASPKFSQIFSSGIETTDPIKAEQFTKIKQWIAKNHDEINLWKSKILAEILPDLQQHLQNPMLPFPKACLEYVEIYADSIGDEIGAFQITKAAAEAGSAKARYLLSEFYHFGVGTRKNSAKADEWLQKAAAGGYAEAEYTLGELFTANAKNQSDYKKALNWYSLAAEHEHAGANLILGLAYGGGTCVKKDGKRAVEYFQRAIELGEPEAYYYLAVHYEKGDGVTEDPLQAVEYYSLAAVLGDELAIKYLNREPSLEAYYQAAAESADDQANDPNTLYLKGCYYENLIEFGDAPSKTTKESNRCLKKAAQIWQQQAEKDDGKSQMLLGLCYLNGRGVPEDGKKASEWLQKAAANGYKRALYHIGEMYHLGDNIEFSDRKANHYFIAAAENGDANAMQKLGESYFEGYGVKKDLAKATEWYQKAAELGDTCAARCLAYCEDKLYHHPESARLWYVKAAIEGDRAAQVALVKRMEIDDYKINEILDQAKNAYLFSEYYDDILEEIKPDLVQPQEKAK